MSPRSYFFYDLHPILTMTLALSPAVNKKAPATRGNQDTLNPFPPLLYSSVSFVQL